MLILMLLSFMRPVPPGELPMYVPKPASGDYLGRSTNARKKAFVVRKKILMVLLDFFEKLDVVGILSAFLKKFRKVEMRVGVKLVFLRYYNASTESRSLPWHIDNCLATVVITMPFPAFFG